LLWLGRSFAQHCPDPYRARDGADCAARTAGGRRRRRRNKMRRAIVQQKPKAVTDRPYSLGFATVGHIPLLASQQGGVAAPIQKMLRSLLSGRSRGGFPFVFNRETTPASRSADASRYFIPRSATPPCRDARRGIRRPLCAIVCATILTFQPFASAATQQSGPSGLQEVGIDQRLGAQLDLNLQLRDES